MATPSNSSRGTQVHCCCRTSASLGSFLLSTEEARLSLAVFYCLGPFCGTASPFSNSYSFLFFFKLGMGSRLSSIVGRGGGIAGGGLDPEAPWRLAPLFFRRLHSPVFLLSSGISFSSMESLSTHASCIFLTEAHNRVLNGQLEAACLHLQIPPTLATC